MDDKNRYFSIFENMKKEHEEHMLENINNKILLVDFFNTFIRSYCGSPAMNNNGEHVGGITGFLYSIGNAIKTFGITRCILVSDGENSGLRKRKIYPDYKEKRKAKSLNRQYNFNDEEHEKVSLKIQLNRLLDYLKCLPLQLVIVDNVEADDVISYIAQEVFCKAENKVIIMSSDKDFIQLCDDRINIWSPTKKKLYTPDSVLLEYGISVKNFLFYRILDGDVSDNIGGIKGVGLKTIKKYLPILSNENKESINSIIEYADKCNSERKTKLGFYNSIINSKDKLLLNESLMQLERPNMSGTSKMDVSAELNKKITILNRPMIQLMYIKDGLSKAMPDINGWLLSTFTKLNSYAQNM